MTTIKFILFLGLFAMSHGQFVSYILTYTSLDCSGIAGQFHGTNVSSCTTAACSRFGLGSFQAFCYTGTLASLANPVVCSGCAYCGAVDYTAGSNCDPNSWTTTSVERLGVCVNPGSGITTISYGCLETGFTTNLTQYSDATCTIPVRSSPATAPVCVPGQPVCRTQFPVSDDLCSYTNLFTGGGGGGGGQNGTHGTGSTHVVSFLLVVGLLWAAL